MKDLKQYIEESLLNDYDAISKGQDDGMMIDQWISTCVSDNIPLSELKYSYNDGVLHMGAGGWICLYITKPIPSIIKKIVLTSSADISFKYKVKDPEIFALFETKDDTVLLGAIFDYALDGIREVKNTTFNAVTFRGASVKFKNCKLIERGSRSGFVRLNPKCRQTLEDLIEIEYIPKGRSGTIYIPMDYSSLGKRILRATKVKDESKRRDLHDIQKALEKWLPNGPLYWYRILFHTEDKERYLIYELQYHGDTKEWRVWVN